MPPDPTSSARSARFDDAAEALLAAMDAIRELAQVASSHVETLDDLDSVIAAEAAKYMPDLSEDVRRQAAVVLRENFKGVRAALATLKTDTGEVGEAERREITSEGNQRLSASLRELIDEPLVPLVMIRSWNSANRRPARARVMRKSLLITAVSDFEVLVAALIREFVRTKPEILRSDDERYTLADIDAFGDLEAFRQAVVERFAEGLMRGGFDDWMEWLEKRHKVGLGQITPNPDRLREIFQRRHLLVHNGGVVNQAYLSKTNREPPFALGTKLGVGDDYLMMAVDALTLAGLQLTAQILRKCFQDDDGEHPADRLIAETAYELLVQNRNDLVIALAQTNADLCLDESDKLYLRVNGWIAQKRVSGVEAIKPEVEAWQTAVLDGRFKLAKLALLDQNAEAYALVKQLLESGDLALSAWRDWPLLEGVRAFELLSSDDPIEEEPESLAIESEDEDPQSALPNDDASA
jgi:hypothetical protein